MPCTVCSRLATCALIPGGSLVVVVPTCLHAPCIMRTHAKLSQPELKHSGRAAHICAHSATDHTRTPSGRRSVRSRMCSAAAQVAQGLVGWAWGRREASEAEGRAFEGSPSALWTNLRNKGLISADRRTSLLSCLQYPVPYLSRLQRIYRPQCFTCDGV